MRANEVSIALCVFEVEFPHRFFVEKPGIFYRLLPASFLARPFNRAVWPTST